MHLRQTVLAGAEKVTGATEAQVLFGDPEAVVGAAHDLQPGADLLAVVVRHQDAVALMGPPAHPAAELVELAQAEALRVLHDHQRGVGHVHPHLDHRGGHQNVCLAGGKGGHNAVLVFRLHFSVDAGDAQLGEGEGQLFGVLLGGLQLDRQIFVFLHHGADHKDLTALAHLLADKAVEPLPVALVHGKGVHLLPPGGQLVDDRHVQIAVDNQGKSAGNGRCGHDQHMGPLPLSDQGGALAHAEAVLLVRHHQTQPGVFHILAEQGVGPYDQIKFPVFQRLFCQALFLCAHGAGQLSHPQAQRAQQSGQRGKMLLGQNLRGGHKGAGIAALPGKPDQRRRH